MSNKVTRSSYKWAELPGSADTVNAKLFFASDNPYGIPLLDSNANQGIIEQPPKWLAPYHTRIRNEEAARAGGLHCFLEDYRYETTWTCPVKSVAGLQGPGFGTLVSPDFSLYRDWPLVVQMWNTYRSRWVAAWWQHHGLRVVPAVAWSTPASYEFCFLGIPPGSVVAISTVGLGRDREGWRLFERGLATMLERLCPALVLCYGGLAEEYRRLVEEAGSQVKEYPARWSGLRAAYANECQWPE